MKTIDKVPRTHTAKKATERQQQQISAIRDTLQRNRKDTVSWLEAKHEYFENQEKYDKLTEKAEQAAKEAYEKEKAAAQAKAAEPAQEAPKKAVLTIAQAKLGITMVLDPEDCKALGMDVDTTTTSQGIDLVREKLGLKSRAQLAEERKAARSAAAKAN